MNLNPIIVINLYLNMAANSESESKLLQVRDVDWTNPNVNRASIIPIVNERNYRWIGLGISNHSANLTTIGGGYEKMDHDLLSTAVREWNEEMVPNVSPLSEVDLYKRYAIQSKNFINILLPSSKLMKFKPTDEIHSIIWVTPSQLKAMHQRQNVILSSSDNKFSEKIGTKITGTRAYLFSRELAVTADDIVDSIETTDIFTPVLDRTPFERPKREPTQKISKTIVSIDQFLKDIHSGWHAPAVIVTTNHIVISRPNQIVYKLPRIELPKIIQAFNQHHIQILVALSNDIKESPLKSSGLKNQNVLIVEHKLRQTGLYDQIDIFKAEIAKSRSLDEDQHIQTEVELIFQYEFQTYQKMKRNKRGFATSRACFLQLLNIINHKLSLSKTPMTYMSLIAAMTSVALPKCPKIMTSTSPSTDRSLLNLHQIVSFLIKTGLLNQDPSTTVITIP